MVVSTGLKHPFHTEEKRPQDVTDRVPKNDDGTDRIRKAGEYYAEAKDVFCAVLKSANNAYLVADSYYKAYQDVADRAKLMGYDQHDQTIYVPYNQHEKEFHYYIGACNNSNYEK